MPFSPIQVAKTAKLYMAARLNMWKFAKHCERRFRGDIRYDLQNVTNGFLSRLADPHDDSELLERISAAYIRSVQQQPFAPEAYKPTERWQQVRQTALQPFIQALLGRDIAALGNIFRNFYRDRCSSGLLGAPNGMSRAYFGGAIKDVYRRFYLGHVLYRFDYWEAQTGGRFTLRDLAGPGIGNPFGVLIGETHIGVGAEYAHYCAHRIASLVDTPKATIAEIAGGFGGMAYYLLRDKPGVTYLDFDVPERIALASYYLLKAFPQLNFILYGEEKLTWEGLRRSAGALMPTFALAEVPPGGVDVTFSSHALATLPSQAMVEYLNQIERITRGHFFLIGNHEACRSISAWIGGSSDAPFQLTDTRPSGWHSHKVSGAGVGGAAGLASSAAFEQCYLRTQTPKEMAVRACGGPGE
jgi:hypothetical protein